MCSLTLQDFVIHFLFSCIDTSICVGSNGSSDSTSENQGKATRKNNEKKNCSLKGRRWRAASADLTSSHDLATLALEHKEEGIDENSTEETPVDCTRSLESETASSKTSTSDSEGQSNNNNWGLLGLLKKGSSRFQTLHQLKLSVPPKLAPKKSKTVKESTLPSLHSLDPADLCYLKSSWKNFSLSELQAATNNFSRENLIGEGGYAEVYKGELKDGQVVAVKRLTRGSPEEMTMDFLSELGVIVHVNHPSIAKLIGYGVEGGMHLVLQLSPHGSLASILYGPREKLDWRIRYKVALGTAEGLTYLHEDCQRRIIHKDIKASNILLTEDFEPQISDFGLSKWLPDQWTHHTVSKVEGTFGYLPPEFFMQGIVDEKTDVFAYGVLLLELITGRQALDNSQTSLVMWANPLIHNNNIKELVDPILGDAYDLEELNRLIMVASMCIHPSPSDRPQMSQVVQLLKRDEVIVEPVKQKKKTPKLLRTFSEKLLSDEQNSTKCLGELKRHMEMVLKAHTNI
ncbi:hypothetical protein Ddye_021910 [Dipteronia dyeriana]|uniref:non-specific serine/threonine protein kinase n=1 Tax=Dipteronia dyeriana TaxID=168575 RepID=A0AAD9U2H5_9ROSI|nr:hypothetical protein Ddye_021910 [Dipteronia dyeriana]